MKARRGEGLRQDLTAPQGAELRLGPGVTQLSGCDGVQESMGCVAFSAAELPPASLLPEASLLPGRPA